VIWRGDDGVALDADFEMTGGKLRKTNQSAKGVGGLRSIGVPMGREK